MVLVGESVVVVACVYERVYSTLFQASFLEQHGTSHTYISSKHKNEKMLIPATT
jgi:DNA-binding transcriptional regulator YhcF (GntR family)